MKKKIFKLLFLILLFNLNGISITNSFFTDQKVTTVNFSSGDWTAPAVKIESLSDGYTVSGAVPIIGSITDNDPHHYWLAAEDMLTNNLVSGFPGVVNRTTNVNSELLYTWDTTTVPDGQYVIKLEARDGSGNKEPNLAPVPNDPEVDGDSVDWVVVTVKNAPSKPSGMTIYQGYGSGKVEVGCDGLTTSPQITIDWDDNPEADIDYYWLGTQFNKYHKKVYAPISYYEANMTPGHNPYYYTIIAVDKDGNESDMSDVCGDLTLDQPPSIPVLEWPINGVVISDNTPLMQWADSTDDYGIAGYYYRIYIGSPTGTVWPNPTGLFRTNSEYQAGTTADNDYYWQVQAEDTSGNLSGWSALEHFVIDTSGGSSGNSNENGLADVVINEVYYDVASGENEGNDSNPDEWVELYNNTSSQVNLKDWTLGDNSGGDTISHSNTYIPANGYMVLAKSASTWSNWTIPSSAVKVSLGQKIGNGLSNSGDRIVLKDGNGTLIDAVSWGDDSYAFGSGNGVTPLAGDGGSIARKTLGVDTDSPSDWEVLTSPNPGTNPHSHIQVDISQDNEDLMIGFSNAQGFDQVKYSVFYDHVYQGQDVQMQIEGVKEKQLDVPNLNLDPLYIGSCSTEGEVCTPHENVDNMEIHLLYKDGNNILGTDSRQFNWQN